MTQRILVVGPTPAVQRRLTLQALQRNQVNRTGEVEVLPAGKGINCARAITCLGFEAEVLLFLGGEPGQWLGRMAREEGLFLRAVEVASPTRTCTTIIESQSGEVTEIVENAGAVDAHAIEQFVEAFGEALGSCWMVVFTGTLPQGAGEDLYAKLARTASERGLPVLLDTQGAVLLEGLAARPLLAKPNRQELAAATSIDCSDEHGLRQAIVRLHALGAQYVLISDGEQPAWLSDRQNLTRVYPPWVPNNNPIGSGDALSAGIAVSLVRGSSMPQAVRYGMACGSSNAAGQGYGRFDPRLAETLATRVRTEADTL